MLVAKKLTYIMEVLSKKRTERNLDGDEGDVDNSQSLQYTTNPTDEDLEAIDVPDDLGEMHEPDYYRIRVDRAVERIEEERKRRLKGTRDDYATALDKCVRAKEIYSAKKAQLKEIRTSSRDMMEDMALRKNRWRQFRDFMSVYSGIKFDNIRKCLG